MSTKRFSAFVAPLAFLLTGGCGASFEPDQEEIRGKASDQNRQTGTSGELTADDFDTLMKLHARLVEAKKHGRDDIFNDKDFVRHEQCGFHQILQPAVYTWWKQAEMITKEWASGGMGRIRLDNIEGRCTDDEGNEKVVFGEWPRYPCEAPPTGRAPADERPTAGVITPQNNAGMELLDDVDLDEQWDDPEWPPAGCYIKPVKKFDRLTKIMGMYDNDPDMFVVTPEEEALAKKCQGLVEAAFLNTRDDYKLYFGRENGVWKMLVFDLSIPCDA